MITLSGIHSATFDYKRFFRNEQQKCPKNKFSYPTFGGSNLLSLQLIRDFRREFLEIRFQRIQTRLGTCSLIEVGFDEALEQIQ